MANNDISSQFKAAALNILCPIATIERHRGKTTKQRRKYAMVTTIFHTLPTIITFGCMASPRQIYSAFKIKKETIESVGHLRDGIMTNPQAEKKLRREYKQAFIADLTPPMFRIGYLGSKALFITGRKTFVNLRQICRN